MPAPPGPGILDAPDARPAHPALAAGLSAVAIGRALAQDPARAAPQAVTLDELSVESRDGAARDPGLPPPTGTIGRAPAPFAGGQVASGGRVGFLGNRSVFDTPFTQSNYTEELIRNQQAQTLADVFANNPSVRDQQPPFGSQPSSFIRGFYVNSRDYAFDGLYGITNTYRPAVEGIERVEILSGPGAFLYGFPPSGSAVGVINLVPKRAAATPLTRVTASISPPAMPAGPSMSAGASGTATRSASGSTAPTGTGRRRSIARTWASASCRWASTSAARPSGSASMPATSTSISTPRATASPFSGRPDPRAPRLT